MASLYIQSSQDLAQHRKVGRLTGMLKISRPEAIGRLHLLWYWALTFAQDGDLGACDAEDIARIVEWNGNPEELLNAFINCGGKGASGFIDKNEDGNLSLHDWHDHCKIFEGRTKENERRKKKKMESRGLSEDSGGLPEDSQELPEVSSGFSQDSHGFPQDSSPEIENKIENKIETETETKTKIKDTPKGAAVAAADGTLPPSEAPHAFKQAAEYLLLKTGRKGLTEPEIAALRTLNAHHYPARVLAEIDKAVDRFKHQGRPLASLTFVYIADSLKNQTSRLPSQPTEPAAPFPDCEPPDISDVEFARLEAKFSGEGGTTA